MTVTNLTNAELIARDQAHLVHPLHEPALHDGGRVWVKGDGAHADRRRRARMHRCAGGTVERDGRARPARARGSDARAGIHAALLLRLQRQLESARHRAGRASGGAVLPLDQPFLLHQRGRRGDGEQHQAVPRLLEDARASRQDEGDLAHRRLSRRDPGGDERHRHCAVLAPVRAAGARLRAHPVAVSVPLRGAGGRQPGACGGQRAGAGDPAGRPRQRRHVHRRARAGRRRGHRAAGRLLSAHSGDLRRVRRVAGGRRGNHRVRPDGCDVRAEPLGRGARHHAVRQGHHVGLLPVRRDRHQRPHRRHAAGARRTLDACLHLQRAPGRLRRGAAHPADHRGRALPGAGRGQGTLPAGCAARGARGSPPRGRRPRQGADVRRGAGGGQGDEAAVSDQPQDRPAGAEASPGARHVEPGEGRQLPAGAAHRHHARAASTAAWRS